MQLTGDIKHLYHKAMRFHNHGFQNFLLIYHYLVGIHHLKIHWFRKFAMLYVWIFGVSDHSIIDLVCLFYLVVFHLSLLLIFVHCLDLNLKAVATVFLLWVFVLRYSVTSMEQGAPAPQCSPLKHIKGDGSFLAILSKFDHHLLQSQSHWISIVFFGRLQWFPTLRWYASFVHGGVGHQQTPKQVAKVHPKISVRNIISFQCYII